ncbi:MAG: hypothetical protein KAT77_00855 [Nanoarchaeota archaeon]|nr:hypothetical protein [Nanoarchaeota archaeon]
MKKTMTGLGMLMYALNSCASQQPIETPKSIDTKANISVENNDDVPAPVRSDKPYGPRNRILTIEDIRGALRGNFARVDELNKEASDATGNVVKVLEDLTGPRGLNYWERVSERSERQLAQDYKTWFRLHNEHIRTMRDLQKTTPYSGK